MMTTADFIARTYATSSDDDGRRCSSVFTDKNGNVYSYGYHYPLVFRVNGLDFINRTGYSSTTAKHISWARRAVPSAIDVWLPPRSSYDGRVAYTLDDMLKVLSDEKQDIVNRINGTKRKNTKKYEALLDEFEDVQKRILRVVQQKEWVAA